MSRRPLIAGNIKMFLTAPAVLELFRAVQSGLGESEAAEVVYFPPFTTLADGGRLLRGSSIALGGQNLHWEPEGAFTGEVSARMLLDVGCRWALIGHSERRQYFGETDATVRRKVGAALAHGLFPMVCVGETLEERESGAMEAVLARQIGAALEGLSEADLDRMAVAYEPVWAIGTGKTATPDMAEDAHRFLRGEVAARTSAGAADRLRLLYGGSVKPDNAAGLLGQPDIDGALVGGACLAPASFLAIVHAAG